MSHTRPRRLRTLLTAAALSLVTLVAGGCAGSGAGPADPASGSSSAAFPTTLSHAFGATTVAAKPERIVVVGLKEQDYFLALGEVPVAIRDWYGDMPNATWPWARGRLGEARPEVLARAELDYEQIAALRPDVIVGLSSGMSRQEYDLLTKIAPTVAQPTGDGSWAVTWQQMTRAAGQITGRSAEAETLVAELEQRIASVAGAHPRLKGASTVFASTYEGQYYLFSPETTASKVLLDLGLTMSPEVTALTDNANQSATISRERFDLTDVDVAVWSEAAADPGVTALLGDPLYTRLDVRTQRREVFLGTEANGALAFASVLSLPYVLDKIVPALTAAVDGDPATDSEYSAK
ncbi:MULTISPECIES: iron-siderophore ABC transporter substrate-binding protein [Micromonospora]|uniref:Iron complex transport system substrate-binding protein n=1 Tax=Micromonospora yangpuensis TaxID=683228 RepID=A0A1C6V4X4_9ACTN|nr:iron-siderophore ABC transporter substrate-binding protein [Micromonospora yangpuensis]GGM15217.1 ABC transporter substrate-binding protein [Micromonospora yangpuensis]SCL60940.1 iron complex transport system substrate-binding protein [Micromonospora yangpuensis]